MKKNKTLKNIILILSAILLAAIIEIVIFNGIKMYNIKDNKGKISLSDKFTIETKTIKVPVSKENILHELLTQNGIDEIIQDEEQEIETINKEETILTVKLDKTYVDRLTFYYKTDSDITLSLKIKTFDEYGSLINKNSSVILLKEFNSFTRVIDGDISEILLYLGINDDINFDINDIIIKNEFSFNIYRFILISIFLVTICLIYIFRKTILKRIEYLFALIALTTGLALILLTPCLTAYSWDDYTHLDRMYSLFDSGEVETSKAYDFSRNLRLDISGTPTSYEDFNKIHNYLNKNSNVIGNGINNEKKYISYDNYSYIPSAIILKICKWLKVPYTITFYLGKIINLLVYILIMFYTIKHAKVGKKLLFVLALLPSTIFLASQYSRDAIISAGIYLAVSTFLNCYCTKEKLTLKNLLIFILSTLIASFSKMIYIPILLLLVIMPKDKFVNKDNSKWIKILAIILFVIAMCTFILPAANASPDAASDYRGGNTSAGSQLQLIKNAPISFIKVFYKYISTDAITQFYYRQTLGGWYKFTNIYGIKYYLVFLSIILCAICTSKNEKIIKYDKKLRLFLIMISLFIMCLICGSMYLSYTPVGSNTIIGAQPRYYVPLLFGFYMAFKQKDIKVNLKEENIMKVISIVLLYIYFFMIYNSIFLEVAA